jgi:predicted MFS family arabinose efflux permease
MILWGIVMAMHEATMRAAVADLAGFGRRGTAYGIFNTIYGAAWLVGNTVIGTLYNHSLSGILAYVALVEIAALLLLALTRNIARPAGPASAQR